MSYLAEMRLLLWRGRRKVFDVPVANPLTVDPDELAHEIARFIRSTAEPVRAAIVHDGNPITVDHIYP